MLVVFVVLLHRANIFIIETELQQTETFQIMDSDNTFLLKNEF